jgi:Family of unknown function (DUF6011)
MAGSITQKQRNYILLLAKQKELSSEQREYIEKNIDHLDMSKASYIISKMKELPGHTSNNNHTGGWPDIPAGRYAVEHNGTLKFYKVDRPTEGKYAGYTFLDVQASAEFYPIKSLETKREVLGMIAKDPKAAAIRYGKELGYCGICGRELTRKESIARGIGPICATRFGY